VIAEAGTLIGYDGGRDVTTPFDGCVVVMPHGVSTRASPPTARAASHVINRAAEVPGPDESHRHPYRGPDAGKSLVMKLRGIVCVFIET